VASALRVAVSFMFRGSPFVLVFYFPITRIGEPFRVLLLRFLGRAKAHPPNRRGYAPRPPKTLRRDANALRNKVEAFRREHPGCHKAIHVVMVTLGGVARNAYYHEIVTDDIRGEDLFS